MNWQKNILVVTLVEKVMELSILVYQLHFIMTKLLSDQIAYPEK